MESEEKVIKAVLSEDEIAAKLDEVSLKYLGKGYGVREGKRVRYSPIEALYLTEIGRMEVFDEVGVGWAFKNF